MEKMQIRDVLVRTVSVVCPSLSENGIFPMMNLIEEKSLDEEDLALYIQEIGMDKWL